MRSAPFATHNDFGKRKRVLVTFPPSPHLSATHRSLWLTATTRESHIVASLYAYPLETAQPKSTAVRFTVNVHGASGTSPPL
jgi:hypothetical protein